MLGINIAGEFLDLSPGTTAQLERVSPFFNDDSLAGEYSLPLSFPYTPRNARLLGLPNHYYTQRIKKKIAASVFDKNNFAYKGELVIETAELDVNDITKSAINGFFVTGVSSFFQQVKNKKLKELSLGGVRNFTWTSDVPASPVKGFWQYVHDSLDGLMEYSFCPIRNEKWSGTSDVGTPEWMNKLADDGNLDFQNNYTTLAPQVSLKYILEQIFEEHGWTFSADMGDTQWATIFIPSFFAVTWQKVILTGVDPWYAYSPLTNITMNLQNHVPPEMLITSMIIALRKRYNWGFEFDSGKKVCRMFAIKDLAKDGVRKDWTKYMAAKWLSDFSEDEKVFAFHNTIDSNDEMSSAPDFDKVTFGDPVAMYADLPAATVDNFNLVVFCWKENKFYQNRYNEDDTIYDWQLYADNIYDYEPEENNSDIDTECSTMPVYKTYFRTDGDPTDFYISVPYCLQEGNWENKEGDFVPWGFRTLFHRGRVYEANPSDVMGTVQYPCLTSIAFTITQEEADLAWSNVYAHSFDGNDLGIIKYWWADTLKYLKQSDVISGQLKLPRNELLNFVWSDVILLKNVPYIMQKITEIIPYDGAVEVEMRRIG